jgi:hypothetical protein
MPASTNNEISLKVIIPIMIALISFLLVEMILQSMSSRAIAVGNIDNAKTYANVSSIFAGILIFLVLAIIGFILIQKFCITPNNKSLLYRIQNLLRKKPTGVTFATDVPDKYEMYKTGMFPKFKERKEKYRSRPSGTNQGRQQYERRYTEEFTEPEESEYLSAFPQGGTFPLEGGYTYPPGRRTMSEGYVYPAQEFDPMTYGPFHPSSADIRKKID